MKLSIKHAGGTAAIDAVLDGEGPQLYGVDDEAGRSLFGFDVQPDGTVGVGYWDTDGEWVRAFTVSPSEDVAFNWTAQPRPMQVPGYGEIIWYRSEKDQALVVEIDTPEATPENGNASTDTRPKLRVHVNDDPVWENPPYPVD